MGKKGRRRLIELGKDVLIVLLTCFALWLAGRTQLMGPLSGLLSEEKPQTSPEQNQSEGQIESVHPMRITASLPVEGGSGVRCAVQYDEAACDALFQQVAGLLVEALSSAEEPEAVTREVWEQALTTAPGLCFDFQGTMPLPVLNRWLAGDDGTLTACVRRLALAVRGDGVALFYQSEEDGGYYCCRTEVVNPAHLEQGLAGLSGNGAFYAFEDETYQMLNPDTLLTAQAPAPAVYTAAVPAPGGQEGLSRLMEDLGMSPGSSVFYPAGDEQVARSGSESIRLSDSGAVFYLAGEEDGHFSLSEGSGMADWVEYCRQLAAASVGRRCGQARLYLQSVQETAGGWTVDFGYSLNGIPVWLESGYAARFIIQQNRVEQMVLYLRSYTQTGESTAVLPARQAAAALESQGLTGEELLLVYLDSGGDTVSADWAAAGCASGEA